jgi:hypothetical protein
MTSAKHEFDLARPGIVDLEVDPTVFEVSYQAVSGLVTGTHIVRCLVDLLLSR